MPSNEAVEPRAKAVNIGPPVNADEWALRWATPIAGRHVTGFEAVANLSKDIAEHLQAVFNMQQLIIDADTAQREQAIQAAVEAEYGWRRITDSDIGKTMLVTNNINARTSQGEMSHCWRGWIQKTDGQKGPYTCFDEADRQIWRLTHCCAIPVPRPEI